MCSVQCDLCHVQCDLCEVCSMIHCTHKGKVKRAKCILMEIERSEIFCVETFCKKCILDVQNETKKWELSVAHKATYKNIARSRKAALRNLISCGGVKLFLLNSF